MTPIHVFLSKIYQFFERIGNHCYRYPLLMGVLLSILSNYYLIADYAVVNRSAISLLVQIQSETSESLSSLSSFGRIIHWFSQTLGISVVGAGHTLMITCHAIITALLLLIAKQLFFSKLTRWALIFLLLANPSYDDFRSYIIIEPLFWCCWLLAIYQLLFFYRKNTIVAILLWFSIFFIATQFAVAAWFWLLLFPFGALFWNPWRRKSVAYALLGYATIVFILIFSPLYDSGSPFDWFIATIIDTPNDLSGILGLNQSNWVKDENTLMLGVFVFSGAVSLVLIRTLISLGIVCAALAIYAVLRNQYRIVKDEHLKILIYLIGFDLFISVTLFVLNKDNGSLMSFSPSLLLFLLAALGLSYVFKKIATARYSRLATLVIIWCLVAYFASGMIIFGPRNGYIRESGEYALQIKDLPVYSNDKLFLFYAERPIEAIKNLEDILSKAATQHFYFAFLKNRNNELPEILAPYRPIKVFSNPREDSVLLYRF